MTKTADYYRSLPYTRRARLESDDGEEYFVAYIEELRGVEADGQTHVEAYAALTAAFDDYLSAMLEWGEEIPEPLPWPANMGWTDAAAVPFVPVKILAMEPIDVLAGPEVLAGSSGGTRAFEGHVEDFRGAETLRDETLTAV